MRRSIIAAIMVTALLGCTQEQVRNRDAGASSAATGSGSEQKNAVEKHEVTLDDYQLALKSDREACVLDYSSPEGQKETVKLDFAGPCDFIRDHTGQPLSYRYDDADNVTVLVVVGEIEDGCGPVARGVLVRGTGLNLSERVARGSFKCPASGLDEKEFWLFAHP